MFIICARSPCKSRISHISTHDSQRLSTRSFYCPLSARATQQSPTPSHHLNLTSSPRLSFPRDSYTRSPPIASGPRSPQILQKPSPPKSLSVALNPPPTTRPPPLSLPIRGHEPAYKFYFRTGRAYLSFYKAGLKGIWTNYKLVGTLKPEGIYSGSAAEIREALKEGKLSRANYQLLRRFRSDVSKLPLFALLFMVCGEFTPLVAVFMTGLVPRTLLIPKQVQKLREVAQERKSKSRDRFRDLQYVHRWAEAQGDPDAISPSPIEWNTFRHIACSQGLYSRYWETILPERFSSKMIQRRAMKRAWEVRADDMAILRDGGVGLMEAEEVIMACDERGLDVLGKSEQQMRKALEGWIKNGGMTPE